MTNDNTKAIESIRRQYLDKYKRTHKRRDCIALFQEIGQLAVSRGAPIWKIFADGMVCWLQRDTDAALAHFEQALALDPGFAFSWNAKGNALFDQKRYGEALAAYEKAISLDAEFVFPRSGKGQTLARQNRYGEALVAFEEALAIDPEFAGLWHGRGIVLFYQMRYEDALASFERAIAIDSALAAPWGGKGNILARWQRFEEALFAYERAIALNPEDAAGFHYNIALLYWRQKQPRKAIKAFQRAIELHLEPEWESAAKSWIGRAQRMSRAERAGESDGDREEADRSSDEALVTDLFEALKDELVSIRTKKIEFKKQIAESVGRPRLIGTGSADNMLLVLRDWNSFSPLLRRELRGQDGPGPDERRGGGYFLMWKGHGIAVDPGVDFVTQLYKKGFSIADIDTVIITHCHLDHTRDAESLVDLNYRYNRARGLRPHPLNPDFRQLAFLLCYSAFMRYGEYLKSSGCCRVPVQLERGGAARRITEFIDVQAVPAQHFDINGRDDEAVGLVFVLKDDDQPVVRVGITSDSRWIASLPMSFAGCDVVVAHMGTIEVGEEHTAVPKSEEMANPGMDVDSGGFLRTDLRDHLGTKGCFRLLQHVKPRVFVVGEFGEELVETRFKILQVFNRLKPAGTRLVLGGDSNLAIGLGAELSVCCSHPACVRLWNRIHLEDVHPVLGGDLLFQYICSRHSYAD